MNKTNLLIKFTKMHGLGNDFIVLDARDNPINYQQFPIKQLANRYTGIGFDQLLVIEPSSQADFFCRFFNADGSEAEQCGNGLRCVARYIHENQLANKQSFQLESKAGIQSVDIENYDAIRVTLNPPIVKENLIQLNQIEELKESLISIISLGNPHAVIKVSSVDNIADHLGAKISTHSFFPQGANVGFMQIVDQHHIRLRTFERGVGETFACGSNACAAVATGIVNGWLKDYVQVLYRYGTLTIEWDGSNQHPMYMIGPATYVYSGQVII